ncbi:MAG TPA: hypothetical protein VJS92_02480 [Candidatus Polarisedimenticolaceae bacterium]|nr:hypothetical protein [Candidatus Polarisedimenticolaceae bacterium]
MTRDETRPLRSPLGFITVWFLVPLLLVLLLTALRIPERLPDWVRQLF